MFKHFSKGNEATQQGATNSSPQGAKRHPFDVGKIKEAAGFAADDPNVTVNVVALPQEEGGGFDLVSVEAAVDKAIADIERALGLNPAPSTEDVRQGLGLATLLDCGCSRCLEVARVRHGYQNGAPKTQKPARFIGDLMDDIMKSTANKEKLRDIKRQERGAEDKALGLDILGEVGKNPNLAAPYSGTGETGAMPRPLDYRDGNNADAITAILTEVGQELAKAEAKHAPMNSAHEGHSVIREEVEELWDHVKADTGYSPAARKEAIQIAAMAVRYILNLGPFADKPSAR